MQTIISKEKPPIYEKIRKVLKASWNDGLCIVYGNTIYSKNPIPPDIMAHEEVHIKQQSLTTPEKWWKKYLNDPKFRLEQEVEACRIQAKYLKEHTNVNEREYKISKMATYLNSDIYGNLVSYDEALKLIKQ